MPLKSPAHPKDPKTGEPVQYLSERSLEIIAHLEDMAYRIENNLPPFDGEAEFYRKRRREGKRSG